MFTALNGRHKAILFVTLVVTGCALLVGAELKEALGTMMLGCALAWAIGSDTWSKLYSGLKGLSGSFYSWIRLPLVMALAGALLGAVLFAFRTNPVPVIGFMGAAGIFIAPFRQLPAKSVWLRSALIVLAGISFFVAVGAVITIGLVNANQDAERMGELAVTGFVVLLAGIFWLSKGWRLIQQGIRVFPSEPNLQLDGKRVWPSYISVFFGVAVLTLLLALLSWLPSSDWAYAPQNVSADTRGTNNNLLGQVAFFLLLASWPYRSWKKVLTREPNTESRFLRRHRRVTAIVGMFFVAVISLSITYGVENGNDRIMVDRITKAASDLTTVEAKIAAIKQKDLRTTADYIQAYSEIDALLPESESQIENCAAIDRESREIDSRRGLINTQYFYKDHGLATRENFSETLDLLRQFDSLTRQETLTIRNMGSLPPSEQPSFWHKEFEPLLVQENGVRQKMQVVFTKTESTKK